MRNERVMAIVAWLTYCRSHAPRYSRCELLCRYPTEEARYFENRRFAKPSRNHSSSDAMSHADVVPAPWPTVVDAAASVWQRARVLVGRAP